MLKSGLIYSINFLDSFKERTKGSVMITGKALFSLKNVSVHYGKVEALRSIECSIQEGEQLAIVGPSGSGKSTFLKVLAGMQVPTSGSVLLRGVNALSIAPRNRTIGFLFQGAYLFSHLTGREHLKFIDRYHRCSLFNIHRLARRLQISDLLDRLPQELSGGQRQRLALLIALATDPDIVLLDEPFSYLDRPLHLNMRREFLSLFKELRKTLVFVTHDIEDAALLSDRVLIIVNGGIIQEGTVSELYESPCSLGVAELTGDLNVFSLAEAKLLHISVPRGTTYVGIRPHHMRFDASGLSVQLNKTSNFGGEHIFYVSTSEGNCFTLSQCEQALPCRKEYSSIVLTNKATPLFFNEKGMCLGAV